MVKKIRCLGGFIIVITFLYAALPLYAADGFGQNTTGGAGGTTVTVTTAADFQTYVETENTPYIIQVSGTLELASIDGRVRIQSNKTIRGIGANPTIIGSLGFKSGCSNVIIERLTVTCPKDYASEEDAISVKEEITNVFITKCTVYDSWDACIDVCRQSDNVTISWCKFYFTSLNANNDRVHLIGNTDSSGDEGTLHVTFHHNWYGANCWQRIPSVRYGKAHVYNCYYNCPDNYYCIRTRIEAECLVENNYFKNVTNPWEQYNTSGTAGKLYASGNILDNVIWDDHDDSDVVLIPGTDSVFTPTYTYTLDDAEDVPALIQYGAGADGLDGTPPHWYYGMYGDFDKSGFVNMKDFAAFASYWGISDCNQLWNADYNGDCKVDFYELGLMSENWLYIAPDVTAPEIPTSLGATASDAVVSLDWDDNTETDLAGYDIYRSTTSGSGYTKLNSSLLTSSDYTDSSVTNDTTYYYVVTAIDTNDNESEYSSEVSAQPSAGSASITIQENTAGFCSVDGAIETEHSGYTGTGYSNTTNASGKGITYSINILTAGTYTFTWRYASTSSRPASLLVDGSTVLSSISFPSSGAFTTWTTVTTSEVTLTAGVKTIRLEATSSGGLANIDYMTVAGENLMTASCQ